MPEYWVSTWLDTQRVKTVADVKSHLASSATLKELKDAASLVVDSWRNSKVEPHPDSLVAGAGIDLSGRLDCYASECRRAQVDRLFRRTWHYFQSIVARDAIAEDLVVHRNCPDQELQERLLPHFETVLIVRELGAESLVEFLPRVPACSRHWKEHAEEAGIGDIAKRMRQVVDVLARKTEITVKVKGGDVFCTLNNPDFSHTQWLDLPATQVRGKSKDEIKREALRRTVGKFLAHLAADMKAANSYQGSMGSTIPLFGTLLSNRSKSIPRMAFDISLPALDGLTTAQLIEVRLRYQESFARFRRGVRIFLERCLNEGITEPTAASMKLKADLIDGELEALRSSLKQAESAFRRKSAFALTLASLVTTIGAFSGVITPPVAFGLAATVTATSLGAGVSRYTDEMARIRADNMYFLLQAENHFH